MTLSVCFINLVQLSLAEREKNVCTESFCKSHSDIYNRRELHHVPSVCRRIYSYHSVLLWLKCYHDNHVGSVPVLVQRKRVLLLSHLPHHHQILSIITCCQPVHAKTFSTQCSCEANTNAVKCKGRSDDMRVVNILDNMRQCGRF